MKALTLTQPWASLVANGAKQIETRNWRTPYRGPLAIHAGKGLGGLGPGATEDDLRGLVRSDPFATALDHQFANELPRGAIVAVAELAYILPTEEVGPDLVTDALIGVNGEAELAFGNYKPGRYAWRLANVIRLLDPIEIPKGAVVDYRGLWDDPPSVISLLAQKAAAA